MYKLFKTNTIKIFLILVFTYSTMFAQDVYNNTY